MAVFAFTDGRVEVNAVVLSDHCTKATLNATVDELETTAFGAGSKTRIGGLKDASLDLEFNQDYAASNVDATIWPLLGLVTTVKLRPTTGTITATNPEYVATYLVSKYTPLDGNVGAIAKTAVTWPGASTVLRNVT